MYSIKAQTTEIFILILYSGGHFNPAVSLGFLIAGGMDVVAMGIYWGCQIAGAILGAAFTRVI